MSGPMMRISDLFGVEFEKAVLHPGLDVSQTVGEG